MSVLRDSPDPQRPLRALLLSLDAAAASQLQDTLDATPGPAVRLEAAPDLDAKRRELRGDQYDLVFVDLTGRAGDRLEPIAVFFLKSNHIVLAHHETDLRNS